MPKIGWWKHKGRNKKFELFYVQKIPSLLHVDRKFCCQVLWDKNYIFLSTKMKKTIMKILNRDVIQQKHMAKKKRKKLRQFWFLKSQFMNLNLSQAYSIIVRYSNAGFAKGKKNPGSKCLFIPLLSIFFNYKQQNSQINNCLRWRIKVRKLRQIRYLNW